MPRFQLRRIAALILLVALAMPITAAASPDREEVGSWLAAAWQGLLKLVGVSGASNSQGTDEAPASLPPANLDDGPKTDPNG